MNNNGRLQISSPAIGASKDTPNDEQLYKVFTREVNCTEYNRAYDYSLLPLHGGGKWCQQKSSINNFFQKWSDNAVSSNTTHSWDITV